MNEFYYYIIWCSEQSWSFSVHLSHFHMKKVKLRDLWEDTERLEPGLLDLKALQFPSTRCTVFCVGVGRVQVGECEREAEETESQGVPGPSLEQWSKDRSQGCCPAGFSLTLAVKKCVIGVNKSKRSTDLKACRFLLSCLLNSLDAFKRQ